LQIQFTESIIYKCRLYFWLTYTADYLYVDRLLSMRRRMAGNPQVIRCDNGPENSSGTIQSGAKGWG
jgi:hypothetical protein